MKLMMVITGMQSGGAERVMATLCNELVKRHSIRLLSMKAAVTDYYLDPRIEFFGIKQNNKSFIKSSLFVKKHIKAWKPDIVLSFMTKSNIIALTSKIMMKTNIPFVIAERANPYNAPVILKWIRRFLYKKADGCVYQTQQAQRYYERIVKCESVILKNPLNPCFVDSVPYTGIRKRKIVTVGRLSEEKNQKLLINAFGLLADKYSEYIVEIYGEGPLHKNLEQHIAACKLQERVFLMGRKENIKECIRDSEIFVLSSNSEGMPNALLEAMALGLACVATDCPIGGVADIINNNENGILISMNNMEALSDSLEKLMTDSSFSERLRNNATNVVEDYSADRICQQWEQYLLKMCQRNYYS